jgi:hypothetical protein
MSEFDQHMLAIADRVDAGMQWLDENYKGWDKHVNPWSLQMEDGNRCVLGQLAASPLAADEVDRFAASEHQQGLKLYIQFTDMWNITHNMAVDMGFIWPDDLADKDQQQTYASALESRWFLELVAREGKTLSEKVAA